MNEDAKLLDAQRKRLQASHDHAIYMATHKVKAIIAPQSNVTYTAFSMLICGVGVTRLTWRFIHSLHWNDLYTWLVFAVVFVVGAFLGLCLVSLVFCVNDSLDLSVRYFDPDWQSTRSKQ